MTRFFCQTVIQIFLLSLSLCCGHGSDKEQLKDSSKNTWGMFNHGTLLVETRFSECGEWGGHKETLSIDELKDMKLRVKYDVYPYNCDSINYYNANDNLNPSTHKQIDLDEDQIKPILDYIQRLTQSKISERFPGHAGNIFEITNSDSTFVLSVYSNEKADMNSYIRLLRELFK